MNAKKTTSQATKEINKENENGNSRCYREIKTIRMFFASADRKYIVGSGQCFNNRALANYILMKDVCSSLTGFIHPYDCDSEWNGELNKINF